MPQESNKVVYVDGSKGFGTAGPRIPSVFPLVSVWKRKFGEDGNILAKNYFDCGQSFNMDNFYNSVASSRFHRNGKTYVTGTLRRARKGIPLVVLSQELKKCEVVETFSEDEICILEWKEKREVRMIIAEFSAKNY